MKALQKIRWIILLALLGTSSAQADGELMVMPATLKVFQGHDYFVTLRNMGSAPLYLNISLLQVRNPGLMPEDKVPLAEVERPGLLASPERVTLGAGQSRKVLVRSLYEPSTEALYRLYVVPARAIQLEEGAAQDKITAPMSITIAYGVLLRHMPPPARQIESWSHRCENNAIVLENTGSVRVLLTDVSSDKETTPASRALFPGTTQRIEGKQLNWVENDQPKTLACHG
ncbi:pilus assembly protein [Herminiimonas sp. KBW02]|uniref:pilus assembly protein n=1 Tax=Herminiimonas sp. KBW02 TaxID=2153363 RepID=UPI000F5970FE|nr:pilus assembly protein [Herminiimonas sp. KBW02]RQO35003.1 pilus assembly protein [Herminiimonas sp. KBW02]